MLIDSTIKEMVEDKYKSCFLWVLDENKSARNFYENNGFKCSHDLLHFEIMGKQLTNIRYLLDLEKI